jgi:putative transposase
MGLLERVTSWAQGAARRTAGAAHQAAGLVGVALGAARDLRRDRAALLAENAFLRQQLAAATRQLERARPGRLERMALTLLGRAVDWRGCRALYLITPDALVCWQRNVWALAWRWRSRRRRDTRSPLTAETRDAIVLMIRENPRWGAKRLLGELQKLSIQVSKRTVQRFLRRERPRPPRSGQGWATFVRNHLDGTWACDFFSVPVGLFSTLYVWFVVDLATRRVLHWNVTANPTHEWLAHQARAVTDFAQGPRFLIRDRDGKFGPRFDAVFEACGTKILKTPPRTPVANAFAERFVGSTRRELLAHLIVLGEDHLRTHMRRWVAHFNGQRPHQGLSQRIPDEVRAPPRRPAAGRIRSVPVMGGLSHHYERADAA